jgi:hypothetical protein
VRNTSAVLILRFGLPVGREHVGSPDAEETRGVAWDDQPGLSAVKRAGNQHAGQRFDSVPAARSVY